MKREKEIGKEREREREGGREEGEKEKERARKNAGVEGKNVSKVKRKEAEVVEEEVEVEVVATVVRGSRNRAGGGPALTDYGLASRRQPAWWGAPGVVVLFPSRLRRLVLVSSLASSSLLCFASCPLFASLLFFHFFHTVYSRFAFRARVRVHVRVHLTDRECASRGETGRKRRKQKQRKRKRRRGGVEGRETLPSERDGNHTHRRTGGKVCDVYACTNGQDRRDEIPRDRRFSSATCRFGTTTTTAKGAGREVSGGAMTTTPRRWMHRPLSNVIRTLCH